MLQKLQSIALGTLSWDVHSEMNNFSLSQIETRGQVFVYKLCNQWVEED